MMFSNVIVDITFPLRPHVFTQSCCEVPASLSGVESLAVGAIDLINRSLSKNNYNADFIRRNIHPPIATTETNHNATPTTTATIPYIKGMYENISGILKPFNIHVAHKLITILRQLRTKTNRRTDKVVYTKHIIDWDSAQCLTCSINYFRRPSLKSWFARGPDSPQQVSTTSGTMQMTHWRHKHYKRNEHNDRTLLTDGIRPITTDLRYLSLTANNITEKLTNQFTRTGIRTFDWQQPSNRLWWWRMLRLSKRQSSPPKEVLLKTSSTRTIRLHCHICYPRVQTIYCKSVK